MKLYKKLIKPMMKIFPYQGGTLLPQDLPDYDTWYPEEELETLKKEIILSDDYAELIFEERYVLSKETSLSQKERKKMKWNTNIEPKKEGWYLVTILTDNGHVFVMSLERAEYPEGNFYWKDIPEGQVVAKIEFPKPYFI